MEAFTAVRRRPEARDELVEPRYLKLIGISVVALWLHDLRDKEGKNDRVRPLLPTHGIATDRELPAAEFLEACKAAAQQRGEGQV